MRSPYISPWGAVVSCIEICKGVFEVIADKGGGIMVHSSAAAFLSNRARCYAVHAGVFLCFGGNKAITILQREVARQ